MLYPKKFLASSQVSDWNGGPNPINRISPLKIDGTTQAQAVTKSTDILLANPAAPTGWYWIKVNGVPYQFWVDNTYDGGGWVLVLSRIVNVSIPSVTYAAGTTGTDIIASSGFVRGTTDQRNYTTFVPLNVWSAIPLANGNTNKKFMMHTASSAGSPGSSDQRRSRWTWGGWSSTYVWNNTLSLSNEIGGETPGLWNYHIANGYNFTTYDTDQDVYTSNCSSVYANAPWWYGACWDGSPWGGNSTGAQYGNIFHWTGSGTNTYNYGAMYVK